MGFTATRTIYWRTPPLEGATEIEEYRFTFGSCLTEGSGRYHAAQRDFEAWFEESYQQTNAAARRHSDAAVREHAYRRLNDANNYGAIIASLRSIETRLSPLPEAPSPSDIVEMLETGETQAGLLNQQESQKKDSATELPWTPMAVPQEWQSFQGFHDSVPWALILALTQTAHAVNPGLWLMQNDDSAKKNGGASAS